jgi:hypothetical protein
VLDRIERHLELERAEVHAVISKLGEAVDAALAEAEDEALLELRAS